MINIYQRRKKLIPKYYNLHQLWDRGLFRYFEEVLLKNSPPNSKENEDPTIISEKRDGWKILAESLSKRITFAFKIVTGYIGMIDLDVTNENEVEKFAEWIASESIRNAEQIVYKDEKANMIKGIRTIPRVSLEYMNSRFEAMEIMLMKAGYRLARLLKRIVDISIAQKLSEESEIIASRKLIKQIPINEQLTMIQTKSRIGPLERLSNNFVSTTGHQLPPILASSNDSDSSPILNVPRKRVLRRWPYPLDETSRRNDLADTSSNNQKPRIYYKLTPQEGLKSVSDFTGGVSLIRNHRENQYLGNSSPQQDQQVPKIRTGESTSTKKQDSKLLGESPPQERSVTIGRSCESVNSNQQENQPPLQLPQQKAPTSRTGLSIHTNQQDTRSFYDLRSQVAKGPIKHGSKMGDYQETQSFNNYLPPPSRMVPSNYRGGQMEVVEDTIVTSTMKEKPPVRVFGSDTSRRLDKNQSFINYLQPPSRMVSSNYEGGQMEIVEDSIVSTKKNTSDRVFGSDASSRLNAGGYRN